MNEQSNYTEQLAGNQRVLTEELKRLQQELYDESPDAARQDTLARIQALIAKTNSPIAGQRTLDEVEQTMNQIIEETAGSKKSDRPGWLKKIFGG